MRAVQVAHYLLHHPEKAMQQLGGNEGEAVPQLQDFLLPALSFSH